MVVVGGEAHLHSSLRQAVVFGLVSRKEVLHAASLAENAYKRVLVIPSVVHLEAAHGEVVDAFAFGQHDDLAVAGSLAQGVDSLFPEVGGHTVGIVAAESIDTHVANPEQHGINHGVAHIAVVVV